MMGAKESFMKNGDLLMHQLLHPRCKPHWVRIKPLLQFWAKFEANFPKYWPEPWVLARSKPKTHTQNMALNYISQGLIKTKATRIYIACLCPIRGKEISWHTSCLCTPAHPVSLGQPSLLTEVKTCDLLSYRNNSPLAFQGVNCPWASGT